MKLSLKAKPPAERPNNGGIRGSDGAAHVVNGRNPAVRPRDCSLLHNVWQFQI